MNLNNHLENLEKAYINFLEYIDNKENVNENFQFLLKVLDDLKIKNNKCSLISFFHIISKVSNNYHRCDSFFSKIEQILKYFKNEIKSQFSNSEIYNIFKSNKRILLFLIEGKIITIDQYIVEQMENIENYFIPEIKQCMNIEWVNEAFKQLPEDFYQKRKIGENENYICELIRNDSIDEFVSYCKKTKYELNSNIDNSIYETNRFLIKMKTTSLIEYAAFFGSIKIFMYLRSKKVFESRSLFLYAIHGNNLDIINLIEKTNKKMVKNDCMQYLMESIKCHHNNIAEYIKNKYYANNKPEMIILHWALKSHNYSFIDAKLINESSFLDLILYDYPLFISILLKTKSIDVNEKISKKYFCLISLQVKYFNWIMIEF